MRFSLQDRYDIAGHVIDKINSNEDYIDLLEPYVYWKKQVKDICAEIIDDDDWKIKFYRHTKAFGEYECRSIFDTVFKDIGRFVRSQIIIEGKVRKSYVYKFKHITLDPIMIEF